jgi:CheY-like chemotaxis protein
MQVARAKILSVEDNPINQKLMKRHLRRRDFEVLAAMNGASCMEILQQQTPDLILMDIALPDTDGIALSQRIKQHNAWSTIPILMVSAHATTTYEEKSRKVGCLGFYSKPVDFKALLGQIDSILEP